MAAPAGGSAREFLRQGVPFLALMTVGSVGLGYMQTGLKEYDDIKREVDQDVETATVGTKRAVFSLELAAKRAAEQNKREQKGYKLQPIQKLDHLLEDDD
jgi:hypothetical protein